MRRRFKAGTRCGRLVLIKIAGQAKERKIWLCRCDCGIYKEVNAQNFSHNTSRSCGCLQREHARALGLSHTGKKGNSARTVVINAYKRRDFHLTDEYTELLLTSNCHYCDTPPSVHKETPSGIFVHGGIDRIDSNKGYIVGNVVPACWMCNCMKNKFSKELFLSHIEKVLATQASKNSQQVEVNSHFS